MDASVGSQDFLVSSRFSQQETGRWEESEVGIFVLWLLSS